MKQPAIMIFFVIFAMFTTFGVMNVMVGMIVDNVFQEGEKLEVEEVEREKERQLQVLLRLQKLLFDIDTDNDGLISEREMENARFGEDKSQEMKILLDAMKIPSGLTSAELIFMLDNDGNGKLEQDEFVRSFFRLIESNDFQQGCMLQVGINHLKNLVQIGNRDLHHSLG